MENVIFLGEKVPIRLIQEPYCKKCMNNVENGQDFCNFCSSLPSGVDQWYFNKIVAMGDYKTCPNEPYNNIPYNIISRMILTLKSPIKKQKLSIGKLIANGLFQMIRIYPFLIEKTTSLIIPPKNNPQEENQCCYFLNPFLEKLRNKGYSVKDLSSKIKRIKDIGKNKDKTKEQRYADIKGVHEIEEDLKGEKILILDDITTSKSTIWDISRTLKQKRAEEVNVLSVGRTISTEITLFPSNFSFLELITYFSNLDNYLEPQKIKKVNIEKYSLDEKELNCDVSDYSIEIDFENKKISHNCSDFENRRYKNKSFCKHLTKLFLFIKEREGEDKAREILNSIYTYLLDWDFEIS